MALVNLETYCSFPNLDESNNVFRYSPGYIEVNTSKRGDDDSSLRQRQWFEIHIPEGRYDLIDISVTIKNAMKNNEHDDEAVKNSANTNTLKSVLEIRDSYLVDVRGENSLASILGFENRVCDRGFHESKNGVNI